MSLPTPNRRADKSSSKNQIAGFSKGDEVLDIELMHQFERLGAIFRVQEFETACPQYRIPRAFHEADEAGMKRVFTIGRQRTSRHCAPLRVGAKCRVVMVSVLVIFANVLWSYESAFSQEARTPPVDDTSAVLNDEQNKSQLDRWIVQLDAPQFAQRESATRALVESGRAAFQPVTLAIHGASLEVTTRVVDILRCFLAGDDAELAQDAERVLEKLFEEGDENTSRLAVDTLDFHSMGLAIKAREKIESLGAIVTEGFMPDGRRGLQVVINSSWQGTVNDFRELPRLRGVVRVGVHGVRLQDEAIAMLSRLRDVEILELYGTGAGDESIAKLIRQLPNAKIDIRKGGKLGVGGQPMLGPCLITQIQQGSAAEKAGLEIGDVVQAIDGEEIPNFETLSEKVGKHSAGETIALKVDRNNQTITLKVKLGGWE